MHKLKRPIRRFLPVLIGCGAVFAASCAFAQNGALNQIVTQYNNATMQWVGTLQGYATNLFAALAAIEFAWTAVILVMEQREMEGWVAAFIKKLMGISFFYALLLKGPDWIKAIIDSFSQIGQNVGQTGALTADGILQDGVNLGGQIVNAAAGLLNPGPLGLFNIASVVQNLPWALLLGAIAIVVILCFVAIAFQFIMAQVEGFIVISAGMIYLGFGGSRWTSSYVERFLGTAVSTGIRIMVFYLIIGLGQTLTAGAWTQGAQKVVGDINNNNPFQGAVDAFSLAASVIIFTVLAFRLPKVVGSVISGSPSLSGGDLAGTVGTIVGGAATIAGGAAMLAVAPEAAPELLAARAGASAGSAGTEGAMSAGKAADAGAGSLKGMSGSGPMDFAGKGGSGQTQPPASNKNASNGSGAPGSNASNQAQPPAGSANGATSSASGTPGSNARSQAQPPSASVSSTPSSAAVSPSRGTAGNGAGMGGSRMGAQAPSTFSPSPGGVSTGARGGTDATPPASSSSGNSAASPTPSPSPASVPESIGSPISAGGAAPPPATYDSPSFTQAPQPSVGGAPAGPPEASPLPNLAQGARKVSDVLHHVQGGLNSLENDGGGAPVSVPPPTEGSLRD